MNLFMVRGFRFLLVSGVVWLAGAGRALAWGSASLTLAAPTAQKNVISVSVPAEVLAFEINLQSSDDDWENRLKDVEATRALLAQNAAKQGLRLVTRQAVALNQASYAKFSSLSSLSSNPDMGVKANLLLVADLNEKSDLVGLVRTMRSVLTTLPRTKGVTMALGEAKLGLEDAEKMRAQLLKKVREHLDATVQALGAEVEVSLTGLDEPVQARQVDERNVELSLPVRASYVRKPK